MLLCVLFIPKSAAAGCTSTMTSTLLARYQPHAIGYALGQDVLHRRSASKVIDLTRSSGRVHRVPRLVCPWHTLCELGRSQFRVLSVALAVDNAEQRVDSGAKYWLWKGVRRTDETT